MISLAAAAIVAAASPTCDWKSPGQDPYVRDVPSAVDDYKHIPKAVREKLKWRMMYRKYDEIVRIDRWGIWGKEFYNGELRGMHFGSKGQICSVVSRNSWTVDMVERALIYCEAGGDADYCIAVPTVCRNVSLITRYKQPPAAIPPPVAPPELPPDIDTPPLVFVPPPAAPPELPPIPPAAVPPPPGFGWPPGAFLPPFWFSLPPPRVLPPTLPQQPIVPPPGPVRNVPEPSTLLLVLTGIIGMFVKTKKGKSRGTTRGKAAGPAD